MEHWYWYRFKPVVDAPMKYTKAGMAKSIVPDKAKLVRMINLVTKFVTRSYHV